MMDKAKKELEIILDEESSKNSDFKLITKFAEYDKETKILNGGKFKLFAKDFKGYGSSFQVDEKKDLYAQNIKYLLKVEK